MKHGIVSRHAGSLFPYQAWPTVVKDDDGVLYVGCSGKRMGHFSPNGQNLFYVSRDRGVTWSEPRIIADDFLDNRDVGLTYLGEKKILAASFCKTTEFYLTPGMKDWVNNHPSQMRKDVTNGIYHAWENTPEETSKYGSYVRLSCDGGETWGPKISVPVSAPHGPVLLSDGRLLYLGKEFHTDGAYPAERIMAFESRDEGRTWTYLSVVDCPEGCTYSHLHEPYTVELPDGRILGAIRGEGDPVPYGFSVYFCYSLDGGRSWTRPVASDVCGSPPHMMMHSSGALVLTYGRRYQDPCCSVRARISYDGGQSFGEEIILSEPIDYWDLGYPSTVELEDGSLYTVYYQRYENDRFNSILYTEWRLDESTTFEGEEK